MFIFLGHIHDYYFFFFLNVFAFSSQTLLYQPPSPLTFADGSGATGLRQAVALTHRAAEAHVHEALRGSRQRRST